MADSIKSDRIQVTNDGDDGHDGGATSRDSARAFLER